MPPPTAAQPPPGPPPPWLDLMKSVVFWGVLAAVVIFAIYQYARQNKELFARIRRAPLMSWLFDAWHWLQNRVRGASRDLRQAVRQGLQRLREAGRPVVGGFSRRFANPRRLPPRERVRFFYLALVRKGQDAGLPRRPYQTPNEYAASLQQNLPEMDEDIHPLTEAFIEARYTRHPVSEAQAGLARRSWERLRRILRRQPHH